MVSPNILIKQFKQDLDPELTPLRIKCPEMNCGKIYSVMIESFDQPMYTLLGNAVCPYCKRFIRETDDPEKILVDLEDIKKKIGVN